MSEHTPTPWEIHEATSTRRGYDVQTAGGEKLIVYDMKSGANAAFIVRAVNAHDELVGTLEMVSIMTHEATHHSAPWGFCIIPVCNRAHAALRKARGES